MQAYSDPKRENDPHALPDVEVFRIREQRDADGWDGKTVGENLGGETLAPGWYWWSCFPGCLPDGEPFGPFATEAEALADAQDGAA